MPFRAWIAVVALVVVTTYAAFGLLEAETVPVAPAVQLSGTVPQPRPPSEGFFVVPPQVVDFSGLDDLSQRRDGTSEAVDDSLDDSPDDSFDDDDGFDDSPDDSPDDD